MDKPGLYNEKSDNYEIGFGLQSKRLSSSADAG